MKITFSTSHISDGLEFGLFMSWQDKHIGIYAMAVTFAVWCWCLELDTQAKCSRTPREERN